MNFLDVVPNEILWEVFNFLDVKSSIVILLVCKRWNSLIVNSANFWKIKSLEFWNSIEFTENQTETIYTSKNHYDLEMIQRETGKEWAW
jgi:hypothetical protein